MERLIQGVTLLVFRATKSDLLNADLESGEVRNKKKRFIFTTANRRYTTAHYMLTVLFEEFSNKPGLPTTFSSHLK